MILDFGKEDKSFLNSTHLKLILTCHFRGICKLVKLIYFNSEKKCNNTVRYISDDDKNLEIIENGTFRSVNKEYVLDSIILEVWSILNNFYEELEKNENMNDYKQSLVCEATWERIKEFITSYHKFLDGDYIYMEDIRTDIFNIIKISTLYMEKKKRKKSIFLK